MNKRYNYFNKRYNYFLVTLILAITTGILIYLAQTSLLKLEISQVLMVIAGMTLLATFGSLQGFINSNSTVSVLNEIDEIDEFLLSKSISSVLDKFPNEPNHIATLKELPAWEVKSNDFVGRDNALAFAKLRIDLERELRQIATYSGLDIDMSRMSISRITDELTSNKVLPIEWTLTLKDIIDVCNKAIHGADISDGMTYKFISAGNELLKGLYAIKQNVDSNSNLKLSNEKPKVIK